MGIAVWYFASRENALLKTELRMAFHKLYILHCGYIRKENYITVFNKSPHGLFSFLKENTYLSDANYFMVLHVIF